MGGLEDERMKPRERASYEAVIGMLESTFSPSKTEGNHRDNSRSEVIRESKEEQ